MNFWDVYDALMAQIKTARPPSADALFAILGKPEASAGEAFALEGGSLMAALDMAGWDVYGIERDYLWEAVSPTGEWIHYVEGDLYRGRHRPPPPSP
jgi:hypothetical protein